MGAPLLGLPKSIYYRWSSICLLQEKASNSSFALDEKFIR